MQDMSGSIGGAASKCRIDEGSPIERLPDVEFHLLLGRAPLAVSNSNDQRVRSRGQVRRQNARHSRGEAFAQRAPRAVGVRVRSILIAGIRGETLFHQAEPAASLAHLSHRYS